MGKDGIAVTQLRVPRELWQKVRHAAVDEKDGVSANAMAIILIEEALEARHVQLRNALLQK